MQLLLSCQHHPVFNYFILSDQNFSAWRSAGRFSHVTHCENQSSKPTPVQWSSHSNGESGMAEESATDFKLNITDESTGRTYNLNFRRENSTFLHLIMSSFAQAPLQGDPRGCGLYLVCLQDGLSDYNLPFIYVINASPPCCLHIIKSTLNSR